MLQDIRSFFPAVHKRTYLNAAGAAPLATPVRQAQEAFLREMEEEGDVVFPNWLAKRENIRMRLAAFLGASSSEVAFVPSTSMGFHVVADAFLQMGVKKVLTLATEFPSTTLPFLNRGLELVVLKPTATGAYDLNALEAALTSDIGAVAVSAVQYASGFRLNLSHVSEMCRRKGVLLALNAAQAAGQVALTVQKTPVDFLCATSHKWMMGGFGIGFFYAQEKHFSVLKLPFASWLSTENPMAMNSFIGAQVVDLSSHLFSAQGATFRKPPAALEMGVTSFGSLFGFGAALSLIESVGIDTIEAHNRRLQTALRATVRSMGFTPNAPDEDCAGICVIPVEGVPEEVSASLQRHGLVVTPRGGGLRISAHIFNDESCIHRLKDVFKECGVSPKKPSPSA